MLAGNLLEEDRSAPLQGCFPPGLLGSKAEAHGDTDAQEEKTAPIQDAQNRDPDLQELLLVSAHLSPCFSLITVSLFRAIIAHLLGREF